MVGQKSPVPPPVSSSASSFSPMPWNSSENGSKLHGFMEKTVPGLVNILKKLLNMVISSEFSHEKWWSSIVFCKRLPEVYRVWWFPKKNCWAALVANQPKYHQISDRVAYCVWYIQYISQFPLNQIIYIIYSIESYLKSHCINIHIPFIA